MPRLRTACLSLAVPCLSLAVPCLSLCRAVRADMFVLANGGRIEGAWLNPDESPRASYQIETPFGGRLTLDGAEVERVVVKSEAERRYEAFLPSVPDTAATLLVPNSVAGATWGRALNSAGIWIKPPPPTAASIKPAMNAIRPRNGKDSLIDITRLH